MREEVESGSCCLVGPVGPVGPIGLIGLLTYLLYSVVGNSYQGGLLR